MTGDVDYNWFQTHAYCFLRQQRWPSFVTPAAAACMYYPKPDISSTDIHRSPKPCYELHHQVCLVDRTGSDDDAAAATAVNA